MPRSPILLSLLVSATIPFAAGCGRKQAAPAPAPAPEPAAEVAVVADTPLPAPIMSFDTVVIRDPEADARVARLELRLLEREAQVNELQSRLDQARQEAVRAMAKLQSLATRAEGASSIAEAEVSVQALRGSSGQRAPAEHTQAKKLLDQSNTEFNKQNYGGAVYLANLAKSLAGVGRGRAGATGGPGLRSGEVTFATLVPLVITSRCNVREGPGTGTRILFTLDPGAAVSGLAYVEGWVRVSAADGRSGWVSRALIGGGSGTMP